MKYILRLGLIVWQGDNKTTGDNKTNKVTIRPHDNFLVTLRPLQMTIRPQDNKTNEVRLPLHRYRIFIIT